MKLTTVLQLAFSLSLLFGPSLRAEEISFRETIAPILLANCHGCHNEKTAEGGYSLATFEALFVPGDSGETPVVARKIDVSELLRRIVTDDEDGRMPAESDPLPESAIRRVRRWIEQGALYDAADKNVPLASILPIAKHPLAPKAYRFPIPLTAIAFVEDDLLVGGYHELLRWDLKSQKIIQRIPQVGERIYSIERDQRHLYIGSGSPGTLGEVRIVDKTSGQLVGVPLSTSDVVLDMELHPSGSLLAVAAADAKIYWIDLRENKVIRTNDYHSDWVRAVAWNRDGTRLASASRDKTAKVFDATRGRLIATYADHGEDVVDVKFVTGEIEKLVSCDVAGKLQLWESKEAKKLKDFPSPAKQAIRLLPTDDGVWFASTASNIIKFQWDGEQELQTLGGHDERVLSLAIDQDGKRLAAGDLRGRVRVWNLEDGELLRNFIALPTE